MTTKPSTKRTTPGTSSVVGAQSGPPSAEVLGEGVTVLPDHAAHALPEEAVRPAVDPGALQALLEPFGGSARERVRAALRTGALNPDPTRRMSTHEHRAWVRAQLDVVATLPNPSTAFPAACGGEGDVLAALAGTEVLAWGDLSLWVKAGVQWGLFAGAVSALGTERHHEILAMAARGELLGAFAMTEADHGSDVASLRTTATFDPGTDEFVVRTPSEGDRKVYIGNAARDGVVAVVFARLLVPGAAPDGALEDHGVSALLVPLRTTTGEAFPGVEIRDCGEKAGLHGVDNGELLFRDVRVPRAALLDRFAGVTPEGLYTSDIESPARRFFTMLSTLVQGRVSVAGASLAGAQKALVVASEHAHRRRQFTDGVGDPVRVLDHPAYRRRLVPLVVSTLALTAAQREVGLGLAKVRDRHYEARVAGHKAMSTWHALETVQTCRELLGGSGFLAGPGLGALRDDLDVFATFEGDNTVLCQLLAKDLLGLEAARFTDPVTTVKLLAERTFDTALERAGAHGVVERVLRSGDGGVDSRAWQLGMLSTREVLMTRKLAGDVRAAMKGSTPADAFNLHQDGAVRLARAHTERLTFEALVSMAESCEDPGTRRVLELVEDLYALLLIERDKGWWLEHERMSPARSQAVTKRVEELCAELSPHVADLVAGFGVPAACVGS